jgi:tetratricopeptide (TPR) repeat protein
VLSDGEARALLTNRLGAARIEAEPAAVNELIDSCGGFPLALSIVASHAQLRPHLPLTTLAAELRDLGLNALNEDDSAASLPSVLSWSYHALAPKQATAFALIGIAPGPDISLLAAAELIDLPVNATRAVLRGLEQASLISQDSHGHYRMHDLIRLYATQLTSHICNVNREAAMRRVIKFYLYNASAADWILYPFHDPAPFEPPEPSVNVVPFDTRSAALTWFTTEYHCLLSAQRAAVGWGWHLNVLQFAAALGEFHYRQGLRHDRLTVWRDALAAVQCLRQPAMEAFAHTWIGDAYAELDQHDEAIEHLHRALGMAEYLQDRIGQARAHQTLSWAWTHREDNRMALHHATRALELARAVNHPLAEALAYSEMGFHTARLGNYDRAREHCQAALLHHRDLHDHDGEAHVLDTLGYIDHHSGRHHQAVDHYQQALSLYRDLGHDFATANTLEQLGYLHTALNQKQQAGVVWREALKLYQRQGRDGNAKRAQHQLDALVRPVPKRIFGYL